MAESTDYKRMNDFRLLGLTIAYYRKLRGMTCWTWQKLSKSAEPI